ncbi:HEAT repeat domain-containing protein [Methylobacillus caricis]|uniref:HEAT repeat domain-containing protein n=1 Tax=Methylobacillus caricis TaxID=1971611 RepID=UPI001CFFCFED|nr:HEAT repeat domain-containing protein [Methylobacillus caricis]MCB5186537.1 HEAT repeat domain-containing protein [Methylobacillus caricis]
MSAFTRARLAMSAMATLLVLLSGCALNMPVPVKDPATSNLAYQQQTTSAAVQLTFQDEQADGDKSKLLSGTIPMNMMYQGKSFDAVPWLARHTVSEMTARGLPVKLASAGDSSTAVLIKRLHIENHRVSGFSPFVTLTSLRADVVTPQGTKRVTAYIKRGKVPVWSFDEIIDPTYNEPLALATKELAAKLNQRLFGQVLSNDNVNQLIAKINQDSVRGDAYMDVYQLGFSNNPTAIPELVKLSTHTNEYIRLAAISSLGILQANDQFDLLAKIYETSSGLWQDRAMALKAIGDLDTTQSRSYLQSQSAKYESRKDKEAVWTKEILSLYLQP